MHNYSGYDSAGLSIGAYIAGKGYWVTPNVTDDSDDRDAANYSVGVEAVADRTVWIAWRMVNGLEGGTYAGTMVWTGTHTFQGNNAFSGHNTFSGVTEFTNASPVVFSHSLTASAGTSTFTGIQCNGTLNVTAGVVFPSGCVVQIADKIIHTGTAGYEELRGATQGTGDLTINPWEQYLWICPTLGTPRTWTLNHPPGNAIVETTVIFPAPSAGNPLTLSDGGTLVILGVGIFKSVVIIFDGTAWRVKASHT